MRVFVTGATGFVGSAVVRELQAAGHSVVGLARSDASADALERAGALVLRGSLEDAECLKRGAAAADAVLHLGFNHDWANFAASCETDRRAIDALGGALAGTDKPLIVTSGVGALRPAAPGGLIDEAVAWEESRVPRTSEQAALEQVKTRGVRAMIMRLPPTVHGDGDHGFVPLVIQAARKHGRAAYVGAGENRWPAVHSADAAVAYRLAMERGARGAVFHAVAEEGVPFRDIAAVVARRVGVPAASLDKPDDVAAHYGFLARFVGADVPASSKLTRELLGWAPTHRTLLEDLEKGRYFE